VVGTWEFKISDLKDLPSIQDNTCGHTLPDHESSSFKSLNHLAEYEFPNVIRFELMKNFKGKVLESTEGLNALIGTT